MTEKKTKTVREMINEANELYDKGEWIAALRILCEARSLAGEKISRLDELVLINRIIDMHEGWNYWKKGDIELAVIAWQTATEKGSDEITQASAHAGLGIYFADKGNREKALYHAKLAQELLPEKATINQNMNLNACGISLAKIGELDRAERILLKVAKINEQLEGRPFEISPDPALSKKAKHQRAKNGYNLVSLIYLPQGRWDEAIRELYEEVIPRYTAVGAETDIAAAYHRMAEAYEKMAETGGVDSKAEELEMALTYEKISLGFWQKHPDDPTRVVTSEKNIANIKNKIESLKQ